MLTVTIVFLLASVICIIGSAMGKIPIWIGVLLLAVVIALMVLPK